MNIINLAVKFSGLGWLWDVLDGYKTYLAAGISILTGLAGVLSELQPFLASHNASALLDFLKHLPQDNAWIMFVSGLGVLGIGHKIEKTNETPITDIQKPV